MDNLLAEKKSITITLSDLDDLQKLFIGLENLFSTILLHYADTNEQSLYMFVYSMTTYWELVKLALENAKKEMEEEENKEAI